MVLKVSVRYTRASAVNEEKLAYTVDSPIALPLNIDVQPGRPNLKKSLESMITCTSSVKGPNGVAVSVCGPVGLAAEVRETVRKVDSSTRSSVGGVELHEEYVYLALSPRLIIDVKYYSSGYLGGKLTYMLTWPKCTMHNNFLAGFKLLYRFL